MNAFSETGKVSERGIEQPQGMGEMELAAQLDLVSAPKAKAGGRPLAHAVHREERGLGIR